MEFTELTEDEYRKYWENHPQKTFLSSPKIALLRKKSNWNVDYVGIKDNNKVVAATMLLSHKRHFNRYEFYALRGFLIDYNNLTLLDKFMSGLKIFLKKKKAYILRIDPYIIYKQRDIDGNVVDGGIDNTKVKHKLLSLGYKQVPIKDMEQVGWMFCLDLDNKSEDEIFKEMKPNTRNTIRKTEKIGINIRELSYDELDEFQKIMIETGDRKGFSIRDLSYFQEMYKLFHKDGEIKYFITELNLKDYIKSLVEEKKDKLQKLDELSDNKYYEGQKKNLNNEIASIDKRVTEAEEIMSKTKKDIIILSGSMFMLIKPEIIYLSSGNYEEYMRYKSQYLIQWEMIKYGIKHGFKRHNFYGIPANINSHPKDYGIYEFKKGFNGYVEELIGEYELPLSFHYYLLKLIHKIKKS